MQSPNYSPTGEKSWLAPTISHPLAGDVWLPGSKSLTNRELVLSALASGPSELIAPLESRDSALMIEDSLWIDAEGQLHPTQQLVISGDAPAQGASINWALRRAA